MKLGTLEKELIESAKATGNVPNVHRLRGAEKIALERLCTKGIMIEVGGCYFLTDEGNKLCGSI